MPHYLKDVPPLDDCLESLRMIGLKTVEELFGVGVSSPRALSLYLGKSVEDILSSTRDFLDRSPAPPGLIYPTGARIRPVTAKPPPVVPRSKLLLDSIDTVTDQLSYIPQMPPVKNQGPRNTCIAFASAAVIEFHLIRAGSYISMSEQFLYYMSKQNDGAPNQPGTTMQSAFAGLLGTGCCPASDWGYDMIQPSPDNEADGPPPPEATAAASAYQEFSNELAVSPTSSGQIRNLLQQGQCVAISVPLFPSSRGNPQVNLTGDFNNPVPGENSVEGHALCIVGFQDKPNDAADSGGRFIVRNSWGAGPPPPSSVSWAPNSSTGTPGYGTISYYYVEQYSQEVYTIPN